MCIRCVCGDVQVCCMQQALTHSPVNSWWMRSAKLGSSPHQKSQSSRRPCLWLLFHTLSTSERRQRPKLPRMGSSSVTGNSMGAEVGPCHTYRLHFMPVRSAWEGGRERGKEECKLAPTRRKTEHMQALILFLLPYMSCTYKIYYRMVIQYCSPQTLDHF